VTALPPEMSRAFVEEDLGPVRAWAARRNWTTSWHPNVLELRAATYHQRAERLIEVVATCGGYRAEPPDWRFVRPGSNQSGPEFSPAVFAGGIFHPNGLICAPWNRLAYKELEGPHDDWGGPTNWLSVPGDISTAQTLADMLAIVDAQLRSSPGMLA
jgi:hypothetical protein